MVVGKNDLIPVNYQMSTKQNIAKNKNKRLVETTVDAHDKRRKQSTDTTYTANEPDVNLW